MTLEERKEKVAQKMTDKWVKILEMEVDVLRSRIQSSGTGHLHTTIGVLEKRIEELQNEQR
tara:strand:- start:294 stop:476 length:183 start_codon:yes stop_codon:yes gene_type:complete